MSITIDALLAKVGAESEFTFEVAGETLKAKVLADASAVLVLERKVQQVKKLIDNGRTPPEWAEYLPADSQVVRMAVYCEALMMEPPMAFIQGLKMAKLAGVLFLQIGTAVMERATGTAYANEAEAITDEKNA